MKVTRLHVENFRAIRSASLEQLPTMVVIAGPNGCGKSCLFDALRLFKSAYGGYNPNEWEHWFSEFQISLDRRQPELLALFRDRQQPVRISAAITLEPTEKQYLLEHADELIRPGIWEKVAGVSSGMPGARRTIPAASALLAHGNQVDEETIKEIEALRTDLEKNHYAGELTIQPNLSVAITPSPTLEVVFSIFQPECVGIIDYHSAERGYKREQVNSVNLGFETEQTYRQHALYNYAQKYQNIKAHMAAGYLRELLMQQANVKTSDTRSLVTTLREMFQLFFPEKEFVGPVPTSDGKLRFPVKTAIGEHDINDLSSGEKEVLYGYLQLRNVAPVNSVLLLDEPELHLNPRLIRGLPQFYHRHLGKAFGNQMWLLTHSDALLREAIGQDDFAVFHMQQPSVSTATQNQLRMLSAHQDIERAVMDLVGDLASYRPGAKVVIFEGGGDSDFDVELTTTLFPEFGAATNQISGSNKGRVRELHNLLQRAGETAALPARFYSIVDRDSDVPPQDGPARALSWDAYHIENYLLEDEFVLQALNDALGRRSALKTSAEVRSALQTCATDTVGALAAEQLERWANKQLVQCIRTGSDRREPSSVASLRRAVESSVQRMNELVENDLTEAKVVARENEIRGALLADVKGEGWRRSVRGRDVLRAFTNRYGGGLKYEHFRNLVIAKMRDANHKPAGMKAVLDAILSD